MKRNVKEKKREVMMTKRKEGIKGCIKMIPIMKKGSNKTLKRRRRTGKVMIVKR